MKFPLSKLILALSLLSLPAFAETTPSVACDADQSEVMSCSPFESQTNEPEMAKSLGTLLICENASTGTIIARTVDSATGKNDDLSVTRLANMGATVYKGERDGMEFKVIRKVIAPTFKINGSVSVGLPEGVAPGVSVSLELACK